MLDELYAKMKKLETKRSPFNKKVPLNAPITWIKPVLVAQLKFSEWTAGGNMRHPVFLGLREDKPAKSIEKEKAMPTEEIIEEPDAPKGKKKKMEKVALTNLDKIYFPKVKLTKGDVLEYYEKIAPYILPYLKDRPESLNRHPNGAGKPNFFHKNFTTLPPAFAETAVIHSESTGEDIRYIVCQNKETLLYLANLGCIEINPWNSRVGQLDFPDYMIIDIDPGGSSWKELVKVAKKVKKVLDDSCQKSYLKTSGKSGLHIYIPLHGKYHFDEVRRFAELISHVTLQKVPELVSLERTPAKRGKKIYLDYLQNRVGQTTACAYSLRPTEGATVSTPLKWSELTDKLDPKKFTLKTIFTRLKKVGDLWKPVITEQVDLQKSILCLEKSLKKNKG
jgi:bifunctional non-homologous end joining protein LigD